MKAIVFPCACLVGVCIIGGVYAAQLDVRMYSLASAGIEAAKRHFN